MNAATTMVDATAKTSEAKKQRLAYRAEHGKHYQQKAPVFEDSSHGTHEPHCESIGIVVQATPPIAWVEVHIKRYR